MPRTGIARLIEEAARLDAVTAELRAETSRLSRQGRWSPVLAFAAFLAAGAVAAARTLL